MANFIDNLFGFAFGKRQDDPIQPTVTDQKTNPSFVPPDDYDGSIVVDAGGFLSTVYDFGSNYKNENMLVQQYRSMSLYPEVDMAIEDIINDSMVFDDEKKCVELNLDNITEISDNIKYKILNEYKNVLRLLDFSNKGFEIFRRWYIDGKVYYHCVIDVTKPEKGIQELRPIDPLKIRKVRKVDRENKIINNVQTPVIKNIEEFYVYTDMDPDSITPTSNVGMRIAVDSIAYAPSGLVDYSTKRVMGYLHKAIRPLNMLRQIEDAVVIYRMSRAPERRVFYVDVGSLPKQKAEQYMRELMNRYRNRLIYDQKTGEIKDDRTHLSMLEDYWIPRKEGSKGTEIVTLDGGQNLGQMEDVEYLQRKLYRALNVPISRLETTTGFNMGRTSEITRDEVKFYKFIERLRMKFSMLLLDILKKQCILKGILTLNDWNRISQDIIFNFNKDSYFNELKENEILREKVEMLNILANFTGTFYSTKYIRKNILKMTDQEISQIESEIEEERAKQAQMQIQQQAMMPPEQQQ
jgi:hypothetical protein